MKRALVMVGVCCLAAGSLALAQEPQTKTATETVVKQKGPGPDTKTKMESVVGTVKEYDAGKKIKISGPNDKTYSFDLDEDARIDGAIVIGQKAKVEYTKDDSGREHVTVLSEATASSKMGAIAHGTDGETQRSERSRHEGEDRDRRRHRQGIRGREEDRRDRPERQIVQLRSRRKRRRSPTGVGGRPRQGDVSEGGCRRESDRHFPLRDQGLRGIRA
jgi:hypothetical protein